MIAKCLRGVFLLAIFGALSLNLLAQANTEVRVYSIEWSQDGSRFAVVSRESIIIYDQAFIVKATQTFPSDPAFEVPYVEFSSDGTQIYIGKLPINPAVINTANLIASCETNWIPVNCANHAILATDDLSLILDFGDIPVLPYTAQWSQDQQEIAFRDELNRSTLLYSAISGSLTRSYSSPPRIWSVAYEGGVEWSPNNLYFARAGEDTIFILDALTGEIAAQSRFEDESILDIVWNPNSAQLAILTNEDVEVGTLGSVIDPNSLTGARRTAIRVLDRETLSVVTSIVDPNLDLIPYLVWSPTGEQIASRGGQAQIYIWDVQAGTLLDSFQAPPYVVRALNFSPYGGRLLVGLDLTSPVPSLDPDFVPLSTFADNELGGLFQFIAPDASPDGLTTILSQCATNTGDVSTGVGLIDQQQYGEFIEWLNQQPDTLIPTACAADLKVVALSLLNESPLPTPTLTPTHTESPTVTYTPTPTFTSTPEVMCTTSVSVGDVVGLVNAISAANANGSSADTICLTANNTYTLTVVNNNTDGPNGLPSITTEITIVGNGATISRDPAASAFRIFHIATGGSLTLDGVTISGGSATSAAPGNDGGAIYNRATVNLTGNTSISNSTANADGGAVYNRGTFNIAEGSSIAGNTAADDGGGVYTSSSTLNVTGGTITDNTAGDEGGGIRSVDSTITLTGANITDNTATGGSGGGLYTTSTALTVTGGVFSGNGGNSGGGLYFTNSPAAASLDGVQILNNTGTNGGGLYLTSSGQAALTNVTVSGNQATSSAAGIWSGGTLTLTDSTVSNNGNTSQPGSAGGIRAAGATLTVNDTVISGNLVNSSSGSGGGVYILSAGTALINGGEISGNDARNGGGLYNGGTLSLSSIIDDNAAQHYGGGLYITGGIAHVDGSIFSNNTAVDRGGAIYNGVTTTSWIHDSCITGNTSADTGGVYSNTAAFDAIDNWWGAAGGPSGAGAGTGDAANSNVTFSPFLTADCPSGTGEGDTQQLMGPQVQMRGAEPTPTLAPVRVPFRATFEDEVDWYASGTWVLDTLNGRNKAPSWTVNTSSRGEQSVLEMRAPINLRGTQSPQLTFWERGQIAASDVVMAEVLPEGASTWSVIDIRSTVPSTWTQRSVSLSAYRGQTIRLRVRVVAGGELEDGTRSTGLWIDDWGIEAR